MIGRADRLAEVVGAVARQALADRGARTVALLDDGGPEADLAAEWLGRVLPAGALKRIAQLPQDLEPLLQTAGGAAEPARVRMEGLRVLARLSEQVLVANPVNRTALLLAGDPPPDPLLPLADLYASEIEELCGGWTGPEAVRDLAERAGGISKLDGALRQRLDARDPGGLGRLPESVRDDVMAALVRGRAARRSAWIVPKIGHRTLGLDLFD